MSVEQPQTPLDPVVRFRIRTVLTVTTIAAIAAAIAAPYWRLQPAAVRPALLAYWGGFLMLAILGGWHNWRLAWRHLPEAGPIAHIVWLRRRTQLSAIHHPAALVLIAVCLLICIGGQTYAIADRGANGRSHSLIFTVIQGMSQGFMFGGILLIFLRRPAYLCETGLSGGIYAPWKYIRHAEWLPSDEGVMKLRRIDGDIYIDVPARERDAVEAFVRTKTKFIDAAPTPELQSTS